LRLVAVFLVPLVLLVLLEAGLRLGGAGYATDFFLKSPGGDAFVPNDHFAWQFFSRKTGARPDYFTLPARKDPSSLRIFVLGESAAMGAPDPAFGFSRVLDIMLSRRYPERKCEVYNVAMRGINSHIIRPIALECLEHQADLLVLYMGNNEAIGLHSPEVEAPLWKLNLPLIRATQSLKSTRLGQLFCEWLVRRAGIEEPQDGSYFRRHWIAADDLRRKLVRRNFQANLEDICRAAADQGVKVVLATVAVNLRDFPPLGSLHGPSLTDTNRGQWEEWLRAGQAALEQGQTNEGAAAFLEAARLDSRHAELQYRLGDVTMSLGRFTNAYHHFALARAWDAMPFRADAGINSLIRLTASRFADQGVRLADCAKDFEASRLSDHGVPGAQLFEDHVHPTFEGNHLLAQLIYPVVTRLLGDRLGKVSSKSQPMPSAVESAEALAFTTWDRLNVQTAIVQQMSKPPFTAQVDHARRQAACEAALQARRAALTPQDLHRSLKCYETALQARPHDWKLRYNLGLFYQDMNQPAAAMRELEPVVQAFPQVAPFRLPLAAALAGIGQREAALSHLREAARLEPDLRGLQQLRLQLQNSAHK